MGKDEPTLGLMLFVISLVTAICIYDRLVGHSTPAATQAGAGQQAWNQSPAGQKSCVPAARGEKQPS